LNILLDLDGTLTDPAPGFIKSIRYAFDSLGIELPSDNQISSYIGPPLDETIDEFLGPSHASKRSEVIKLYRERYSSIGLFENSVYDCIPETLEELHNNGSILFVATAKPRVFATRILQHFDLTQYFSGIYGSELDGTHSNKQELLKYLLREENLDSNDTIMVGDRTYDISAAVANKVKPIGVLWGYGTLEELTDAGAEKIINEPRELLSEVVIV
jgi:phosphoglycolate phosphatase